MPDENKPIDNLVSELQERTREMNCLFTIEDNLNRSDISLKQAFNIVVNTIPSGWQYPNSCRAKIIFDNISYTAIDFPETEWVIASDIIVQDKCVGHIFVYYLEEVPAADFGPFLKEEKKLLDFIAERIGH